VTRQLQHGQSAPIYFGVILSRLFAVFIALSLMFGPLAMDNAMAAVPAANHSQMSDDAHCAPADEGHADEGMSEPCCAAMCAPSVLPAQTRSNEVQFSRLLAVPAAVSFHHGVLTEISTPPPRVS